MPRYGGIYRVSLENPSDRIAGGDNMVAIDPYNGNVLSSVRSNDVSSVKRILAGNEALHTGERWGTPSRLLACLASVIVPVQMISGIVMWWRRRKAAPLA